MTMGIVYGPNVAKGSARHRDWTMELTPGLLWQAAGFKPLIRCGYSYSSPVMFPKPAAGAAGPVFRNALPCYTITNGGGDSYMTQFAPFSPATLIGRRALCADQMLTGYRFILGANAAQIAAVETRSTGLDFQSDDPVTSTSVFPTRNTGNSECRGIGIHLTGGAWWLMIRQNGNVVGNQPYDVVKQLTCDPTLPNTFDVYFINTDGRNASRFELWVNGTQVDRRSYTDAGNALPSWSVTDPQTPDRQVPGPIPYLRAGGAAADGRELQLFGFQFIQGPDVPGVRF